MPVKKKKFPTYFLIVGKRNDSEGQGCCRFREANRKTLKPVYKRTQALEETSLAALKI